MLFASSVAEGSNRPSKGEVTVVIQAFGFAIGGAGITALDHMNGIASDAVAYMTRHSEGQ